MRYVDSRVTMDEDAVRRYVGSWGELGTVHDVRPLAEPLRVRRACTVFVAETAS